MHNISKEREEELLNYMLKTKEITQINKTVGDWDMEIDIETLDKKIFHSEMCLCRSSEFLDMENKKLVENIADLPSLLNEEKSTM